MQEAQVTIEGESHVLPHPSWCFRHAEPHRHEGTYPLPDAQLDRFLLNGRIGYPSAEDEIALTRQVTSATVGDRLSVDAVNTVLDPARVAELQSLAASLTVDDAVLGYAVKLARATRDNQGLSRGAGPRASIALVRCARARADVGPHRDPDDVKAVALAVSHRVAVAPSRDRGRDADSVLAEMLAREAPRCEDSGRRARRSSSPRSSSPSRVAAYWCAPAAWQLASASSASRCWRTCFQLARCVRA
jgi:MoxR-like ATPase